MASRAVFVLSLGLLFVVATAVVPADEPVPAKAREVRVARPVLAKVTDHEDCTGRLDASSRVDLRARVTGYLTKSLVKEGAEVKQGDVLFEIDPRPYRAEVDRAEAALALATARLKLAEATQKRTAALAAQKAATQEELDKAESQRIEAEAALRVAKASSEIARINLDYTTVRAPFAGQIGRRLVDPGNLVAADKTILAALVRVEPIHLNFEVDERTLLRLRKAENKDKKMEVHVGLGDEEGFPHRGTVDFEDVRVNAETGTIQLRAILPNPAKSLKPGMFARVRLALGEPHDALLVSPRAIRTEEGERFVFVLNDKDEIVKRRVVLGPQHDGMRAIREGIKAEDRVVIDRAEELRPGQAVRPRVEEMPARKPGADGPGASAPAPFRGHAGADLLVDTVYPGASAQIVADTVRAPIEQQVSGLEKLRRMRSRCSSDGRYALALDFDDKVDRHMMQVLVQNRVALAVPTLPREVQQSGLQVRKGSSGVLLMVNLFSPDAKYDALYLSNYATIHIKDSLSRVAGVRAVEPVGDGDYGLRIWLDPDKLALTGLNASEVSQKIDKEKATGEFDPEKLADLVLKADPVVRLRHVARLELGAGARRGAATLDGKSAVTLVVYAAEGENAGDVRRRLQDRLKELRGRFPKGLDADVTFDFTANRLFPDRASTPEYLLLDLDVPAAASLTRIQDELRQAQTQLSEVPGVQHVLTLSQNPFDLFGGGPAILVRLAPAEQRKTTRPEVIQKIRTSMGELRERSVRVRDLSGADSGYPIDLALRGPELPRVRVWARKLAERLGNEKKLTDVWANRDSASRPMVSIDIDRKAVASRGVDLDDVWAVLRIYGGESFDNAFHRFGRTWRVDLRFPSKSEGVASDLRKLKVRNARGEMIPLGAFVAVRETEGPEILDFLEGQPMVEVTATPASGAVDDALRKRCETAAEEVRKDLGLSRDYRLTWLRDMPARK